MARPAVPVACGLFIVACSLLALITLEPGLDYFMDPAPAMDALTRGDLDEFFAHQPLMGSLSLVLRAPFAALGNGASIQIRYLLGLIPCLLVVGAVAAVISERMTRDGRSRWERAAVALVFLGSPLAVKAIHWGHPEELLGGALCVAAVLAASAERPVAAGLLLGAALATKQWALIAVLPVLLAAAENRRRLLLVAGGVATAFTLPMLLGDPERFLLILRAAASVDPPAVLGIHSIDFPGARVLPQSVWVPITWRGPGDGPDYLFMDAGLARLTHPLILLVAAALGLATWRRLAHPVSPTVPLRLLALVILARCALDPMSLDYYHVPLLMALAALAAAGGPGEVRVALLATAGLSLAFADPADNLSGVTEHAGVDWGAYMLTIVPLTHWLGRGLLWQPTAPRVRVGSGRRRAIAARRSSSV